MKRPTLTVIDFFSGAGGFSEGFRQQGFKIVKGIDFWEPAVKTHNLNHGLNDVPENVLDYVGADSADIKRIETLPDVDVIIGSPSCVTFSLSNKGGKADKTEGIRLIEAYLRVIAVKKHKKDSRLKAWLMENVPNSGNYVKHEYTFKDLNLEAWATKNSLEPNSVALTLNGTVLNASDFGAPQNRSRFICGETISDGRFPMPLPTASVKPLLKDIRSKMPMPNEPRPTGHFEDPNYPGLIIEAEKISDHFYDTGLYVTQWEQSKYLKTMHPFMGRMSFPEADEKSSRTVTATRSISSRESIIYKSEYVRSGHGEYRTPTIREAASLMGYPYTYQFFGSEGTKWKQIGNSVSPQLSSALAKAILIKVGHKPVRLEKVSFSKQRDLYLSIDNLNTFTPRTFDEHKRRKTGAKFRRSLHKSQNMTIDLLNYLPGMNEVGSRWYVFAFYGTGSYQYDLIKSDAYPKLRKILEQQFDLFDDFLSEINKDITDDNLSPQIMQHTFENDDELSDKNNPLVIISKIQQIVDKYAAVNNSKRFDVPGMVRPDFSLAQLLYMFSLTYIVYNNLQVQTMNAQKKAFVYEI